MINLCNSYLIRSRLYAVCNTWLASDSVCGSQSTTCGNEIRRGKTWIGGSCIMEKYWFWELLNILFLLKQGTSGGFDSCDRPSYLNPIGFKSSICRPVWPWNFHGWPRKTTEHLLYFIKLCESFQTHRIIQTGITVGNIQFGSTSASFLPVWPWKTKGRLFYTMSNFVHLCKAIGEFKLALQSGNAQFGSKLAIFVLCDFEI